mmetsp:Transcript_14448/g.43397  ORF Transcript_14448/g.43397 Transcript_14448/m.43397 type:complete len:272 (-) Transcript_14448:167-982(-)
MHSASNATASLATGTMSGRRGARSLSSARRSRRTASSSCSSRTMRSCEPSAMPTARSQSPATLAILSVSASRRAPNSCLRMASLSRVSRPLSSSALCLLSSPKTSLSWPWTRVVSSSTRPSMPSAMSMAWCSRRDSSSTRLMCAPTPASASVLFFLASSTDALILACSSADSVARFCSRSTSRCRSLNASSASAMREPKRSFFAPMPFLKFSKARSRSSMAERLDLFMSMSAFLMVPSKPLRRFFFRSATSAATICARPSASWCIWLMAFS